MNVLMPTTLVGSLPQPEWLVWKDVMLAKGEFYGDTRALLLQISRTISTRCRTALASC